MFALLPPLYLSTSLSFTNHGRRLNSYNSAGAMATLCSSGIHGTDEWEFIDPAHTLTATFGYVCSSMLSKWEHLVIPRGMYATRVYFVRLPARTPHRGAYFIYV